MKISKWKTEWPKEKRHTDKQRVIRHYTEKKYRATRTPPIMVFQRVSSSYSNTSSWLILKIKTGFKLYCCVLYYFRYCKDVPASPPFFMFLCLPGHVIDFSFWVFCPLYRKFIMRTIELPQCCSCTKYTCLIQPRIIKIRNYYHWRLFIYPKHVCHVFLYSPPKLVNIW